MIDPWPLFQCVESMGDGSMRYIQQIWMAIGCDFYLLIVLSISFFYEKKLMIPLNAAKSLHND